LFSWISAEKLKSLRIHISVPRVKVPPCMKNACSVGKSSIGKKEQHPKLQSSALYDVLGLPITTCDQESPAKSLVHIIQYPN